MTMTRKYGAKSEPSAAIRLRHSVRMIVITTEALLNDPLTL